MIALHTWFQQFNATLARLVRPYRRDFYIGLLATAVANGMVVLIPLTFREGIDSISRHGAEAPLLFYGLAVIVLTAGKGVGDYLTHQRIAGMGSGFRSTCAISSSPISNPFQPPSLTTPKRVMSCHGRPPTSRVSGNSSRGV